MTVAAVTKAYGMNPQHIMPVWLSFYKAAATDMIDSTQLTPPYKGFMPLNAFHFSATACTAAPAMQFGRGRVDNASDDYTATSTSIALDTITTYVTGYARQPPYYVLFADATATAFEICEVLTDSLPATAATVITVKRGCLGTTAGSYADVLKNNAYMWFLNILYLTDTEIGTTIVYGVPFPGEPKTPLFKATPR
jgi:hypothetical protein